MNLARFSEVGMYYDLVLYALLEKRRLNKACHSVGRAGTRIGYNTFPRDYTLQEYEVAYIRFCYRFML